MMCDTAVSFFVRAKLPDKSIMGTYTKLRQQELQGDRRTYVSPSVLSLRKRKPYKRGWIYVYPVTSSALKWWGVGDIYSRIYISIYRVS